MRKKRGELTARFAASCGNERNKLAVEPGFANEKAGRNRDAHPAVFQDIDRQAGAARSKFTIDAKVVVNARKSGFDRRRLWLTLGGISPCVKGAVFLYRQDHPARGMRCGLRRGGSRRNK